MSASERTVKYLPAIACDILARTAAMRKDGSFTTDLLCWDPEELEGLAMYAVDAKNRLARLAAPTGAQEEREP